AAGSRDGDVEPVAAEEEVEVARDLLAAGRRQGEEDNRRLLALELVDGADMYAAGQMGPKAAHLSVVRRDDHDVARAELGAVPGCLPVAGADEVVDLLRDHRRLLGRLAGVAGVGDR